MKHIYLTISVIFFASLVSGCDGDNAKKMLEKESSVFGKLESSAENKQPEKEENQQDDTKTKSSVFGNLE
ncbi:hypothetical protein Nstercoris_02329 (plasmid) [Nitrosomonas stercoris]|uniref:Lipoprotein n=1 Tax=Nitrosomonas stercoris TaxID=1444684 RepID=A0A4Y1YPF2_9PROT|nr:hypothetical protein Nstercoris_02329 [Nitrosomonas stercoris]